MKNIAGYLKDKYSPWGWLGQRAHDAAGINNILPLDFIISCDYGTDIPYYFRREDVFAVEEQTYCRRDWSNEDLNLSLQGALGRSIFKRWDSYKSTINLLCYRSVKSIEGKDPRFLSQPRILAMPEKVKKHFDNKILLYKNLPRLSLPSISGEVVKLGKCTFNRLYKGFSVPFVIQFPYGSSGHFTFIIRREKEYNLLRARYPGSTVLVRKYVKGFSLNVNAVIVTAADGPEVHCAFPAVQITGLPECSNFPSAFCGNDYAAMKGVDRKIIKQVESHIKIIGKWMAEAGFRGIFGMDFLVKNSTVYPVEINPRFQNSTSLYTVLSGMAKYNREGLFLLHIAEFLQNEDKNMRKYIRDFAFQDLMDPMDGCQIIVHNRMRSNVVTGDFKPGIYRVDNEKELTFTRGSALLGACRNRNEILITCGVPRRYTVVEPNAPICKIQMPGGAVDIGSKRTFTPGAKKLISKVYAKFGLKDAKKAQVAV